MTNASDTPDLDELARKYLDLWQEHLNALAENGETMDALARTVALMNSGAAAFTSTVAGKTSDDKTGRDDTSGTDGVKPETPGAAHEPANPDMAQCLERIAALEQRVAELESPKRKRTPRKRSPAAKS